MKLFYLAMSGLLTVIILILAFENITASCSDLYLFFWAVPENIGTTILIFMAEVLGILTGVCYTNFVHSMSEAAEEEEDQNY